MNRYLVSLFSLLALPAFASGTPAPTPIPPAGAGALPLAASITRADYVMGDKKAPVLLMEYASLSCPHCAHFHEEVLPKLEKDYIKTGKMKLVLRQFPLNEPALKGALVADCAGEDKGSAGYYAFNGALFDGQKKWAFDANFITPLESFARTGGMSKERFAQCTSDTTRELKLLTDKKTAVQELKIDHTPYFFINGVPYQGKPTEEDMRKALDEAFTRATK